jgi:hypothetical protein
MEARRVAEDVAVIEGGDGGTRVVSLSEAVPWAEGGGEVGCEALVLDRQGLTAMQATGVTVGSRSILQATTPVSLEIMPGEGRGLLLAEGRAEVSLTLAPDAALRVNDGAAEVVEPGLFRFPVEPGTVLFL